MSAPLPRFRAEPHGALRRALAALLGSPVEPLEREPWASLNLSGLRHRFAVARCRAVDSADGLSEHEFDIPGHLVAEIAVVERHRSAEGVSLVIEALTVRDD